MQIFSAIRVAVYVICFVMAATAPYGHAAEKKDGKAAAVATINGVTISGADFQRNLEAAKQQFAQIGWKDDNGEKLKKLKKEVLHSMIDEEILYQESKKKGIAIEEKSFTEQYSSVRKNYSSDDEFNGFLKSNGFASEKEFKDQLKRKLAVDKFRTTLLAQFTESTRVEKKDAIDYYEKNKEKFKIPESVKASHILISVAKDADDAAKKEARKQLEGIQKKLKAGEEFEKLAMAHSSCPSAKTGGDLGFFVRGQMVKPFEEAAFKTKPGEISDIVETQFGYHLIKVTEKQAEKDQSFDDVKEKIKDWLLQESLETRLHDYIHSLRDGAKIETH